MKRFSFPHFAFLLVLLLYSASFIYYHHSTAKMLCGGDQGGYYLYLPSLFIYHDLSSFENTTHSTRQYNGQDSSVEIFKDILLPISVTGNTLDKYTCGVALMDVPFFFVAHLTAYFFGYPMDGYSRPYSFLIQLGGMIYVLMGLWLLLQVLKERFSNAIAGLVILVSGFATNLYFFSVIDSPMAHSYLFFLYCLLIYATVHWYRNFHCGNAVCIGFCCGLITMIRPNEILCILIPILYGIHSKKSVVARIQLIARHPQSFVVAAFSYMIAVLPQLIYWKYSTGHFLFYSYTNESFDFRHPHIVEGVFGWKNGWLAYTPVMIFSLAGILLLFKKRDDFFLPILIILPLYIFVIYSWWCWNYINGFGSRPMVELYPLLAFPLGHFIEFAWKSKFFRSALLPLFLFFSWLNIFNSYQFTKGLMFSEDGNFQYFLAAFAKTKMDMRMLTTYDLGMYQPRHLTFARKLLENHFADSTDKHYTPVAHEGRYAYQMSHGDEYSSIDTLRQSMMNLKPGEYLKISFWGRKENRQTDFYRMVLFIMQFVIKGRDGEWQWVRIDNKLNDARLLVNEGKTGRWMPVSFFLKPPSNLQPEDFVKLFLFNGCKCDEVKMDDLLVEVWK